MGWKLNVHVLVSKEAREGKGVRGEGEGCEGGGGKEEWCGIRDVGGKHVTVFVVYGEGCVMGKGVRVGKGV